MTNDIVSNKIEYVSSLPAVKNLMDQTLLQTDEMLLDMMKHLTLGVGKNLRAMLLLAASTDSNGFVTTDAVVAAASVEMLHLATLVHDDVIDDAKTRRGQNSIQSRFGKKEAVICGDYLFCITFSMVADISAKYPEKLKEFTTAMTNICLGELRQFKHNADVDLDIDNYLKIIEGKTAALFSLAMYSGALINGDSDKDARFMGRIGFNMGMLFQILDDCADYESEIEVTKKTVKHDLADEVITLPLIYALSKSPELKKQIRDKKLSANEIRDIIAEVIRIGGVKMAFKEAERYYLKAKKMIDSIPDRNKQVLITGILEKIWKGAK